MNSKELQKLSNAELIIRAKDEVKVETNATLRVLHTLKEIERRRAFAEKKYLSLFDFCVDYLGYKKGAAYRRILAMQALKEMPEVEEKVQNGSLDLMTLVQAQSYFKEMKREEKPLSLNEKKEIVQKLENKSTRETEKFFLELSPKPVTKEKLKATDSENFMWQVSLPLRVKEKIEKLRKLLGPDGNNLDNISVLEKALDLAIEETEKQVPALELLPKPQNSKDPRNISIKTKRFVWHRDQSQCTQIDPATGERCSAKRNLEIDHKVPVACGGTNDPENLRLLCRSHNQLAAIRNFGLTKMDKFINGH